MVPRTLIDEKHMKAFVSNEADFAFEMRTLHALRGLGFECDHAATYQDPITEKIRQYDIRARKAVSPYHLWLSVECKNIGPESPLLVHAVPRTDAEAFHQLIRRPDDSKGLNFPATISVKGFESAYPPQAEVGKQTDQVTVRTDGTFAHSDSSVFEKISQSVNSARDLVREAMRDSKGSALVAVVPVLVLPENQLWQATYKPDGAIDHNPTRVTRTTLYLNHPWTIVSFLAFTYRLSHLEITTSTGLRQLVEYLLGSRGVFALGEALYAR